MKILIATGNRNKVKEIQQIIDEVMPGRFELVIAADVTDMNIEVEETGETLEENAQLKADVFNKLTGEASIADDTGLEIDFLGGRPGVRSARFAGEDKNDFDNRQKVLSLMAGLPDKERIARFRTVICFTDGMTEKYFAGICPGRISINERGSNGFGYDPIFIPEGYEKTFAEMEIEEKNSISHRRKAIDELVRFLASYSPSKTKGPQ
jgi:XTP/dITP diphosphohydrolase